MTLEQLDKLLPMRIIVGSTNAGTAMLTASAGANVAIRVQWDAPPSDQDLAEFQALFEAATGNAVSNVQTHKTAKAAIEAGREWVRDYKR